MKLTRSKLWLLSWNSDYVSRIFLNSSKIPCCTVNKAFVFIKHYITYSYISDICRKLLFKAPIDGHALKNHVIKNISLERPDACDIACFLDNDCLSYNFGRLPDGDHICQLSDSGHMQHPGDLQRREEFTYRGTKVHY